MKKFASLAYFVTQSVTNKKRFVTLTPGRSRRM